MIIVWGCFFYFSKGCQKWLTKSNQTVTFSFMKQTVTILGQSAYSTLTIFSKLHHTNIWKWSLKTIKNRTFDLNEKKESRQHQSISLSLSDPGLLIHLHLVCFWYLNLSVCLWLLVLELNELVLLFFTFQTSSLESQLLFDELAQVVRIKTSRYCSLTYSMFEITYILQLYTPCLDTPLMQVMNNINPLPSTPFGMRVYMLLMQWNERIGC